MHASTRRGSGPVALLLALALSGGLGAALSAGEPGSSRCPSSVAGEAQVRSELFFGLSQPHGSVAESEFADFVEREVTPRFPQGLTLLDGSGRFRDARGSLVAEGSKLVILLYPGSDTDASPRIEAIRDEYKRRFDQQSVLRADSVACVAF
jgi:hypothetical protein